MQAQSAKSGTAVLQEIHVRPLLAHLDLEESLLRDAKGALLQTGQAVNDPAAERQHRQRLDQLIARLMEISQQRTQILRSYAKALKLREEDISLGMLIRRSSADAAMAISATRRRITRLVRELQHLSATAGWIMQQSRQINLSLLEAVSGEQSSDRYTASGQLAFGPRAGRSESRA